MRVVASKNGVMMLVYRSKIVWLNAMLLVSRGAVDASMSARICSRSSRAFMAGANASRTRCSRPSSSSRNWAMASSVAFRESS